MSDTGQAGHMNVFEENMSIFKFTEALETKSISSLTTWEIILGTHSKMSGKFVHS